MTQNNVTTGFLCALSTFFSAQVYLLPNWAATVCLVAALSALCVFTLVSPKQAAKNDAEVIELKSEVEALKSKVMSLYAKIGFKP